MYVENFQTPRGSPMLLAIRGDTNDGALAKGLLDTDEYRLKDLPDLTGWALDIGAHVGTVTIALAIDHPGLKVIAVEPVPDNVELLRQTRLVAIATTYEPDTAGRSQVQRQLLKFPVCQSAKPSGRLWDAPPSIQ